MPPPSALPPAPPASPAFRPGRPAWPATWPLVMVRLLIATVPAVTLNTRLLLLPSIASTLAPGPRIVVFWLIVSWPSDRLITPVTLGAKVMVLASALALAAL